jgi:hypothetical protein
MYWREPKKLTRFTIWLYADIILNFKLNLISEYLLKIPNSQAASELNSASGGQKRDRSESSAAEIPAPKTQKKTVTADVSLLL